MEGSSPDQAPALKQLGRAGASYLCLLTQAVNQLSLRTWAIVDLLLEKGVIRPDELESVFAANRVAMLVDAATWAKLREATEQAREGPKDRATVNTLLSRIFDEYLARKGGK